MTDIRKDLKRAILQTQADELSLQITKAIAEFEQLSEKYDNIVQEIYKLGGMDKISEKKHAALLDNINAESDLSDDILPDVGDNSEIWDRIATAQQALECKL